MKRPHQRQLGQLSLFDPKPRAFDEEALMRRLQEVVDHAQPVPAGMSRAAYRRLMTPLPRITVPR